MPCIGAPTYTAQGLLVRNVKGDGSCGYRAVMYGMLEHDWVKTVDRLPASVAMALPASRPRDIVALFEQHDRELCAAARNVAVHRIMHDPEIREWAGDPGDRDTEAGRALVDARDPHGYMDEVALHALAKALDARIAVQFRQDVLKAPFKNPNDSRPVSVCLKPLNDDVPSEFVCHYMLCYPGKIKNGNRVVINPSMRTTTSSTV
tara:strand:- start:406 stop:1020 length:615 start_codon:yes stop_codon:yes gene_type:complete